MGGIFSKFTRPELPRRGHITARDLDLLQATLRYRFLSAAQLVRLVGGNEDVTHRRLRRLWEAGFINRFAFPGFRTHSEFFYYVDSAATLDILAEWRGVELSPYTVQEVRGNREKDYAGSAARGQHMQLGFLQHSLIISRFHFMLEMACTRLGGGCNLGHWQQGAQLAGRKVDVPKVKSSREGSEYFWEETAESERLPVEPDALFSLDFADRREPAHFLYEADRGTMTMSAMLRKLRAYYHLIKKQQKHKEAFGVHPIRAVLVETTDERRARALMSLVGHPLVGGTAKRTGLFWFCISELFMAVPSGAAVASHLVRPEVVFDSVWALPDRSLRSLFDTENSSR